jgi:hypothetical protein|tara:strand:- start:113 stop:550 length:438 start_codon:yes stop_codon:yes gene_type:complete
MKTKEILYLNDDHKVVVEALMADVKQIMYYATEDEIKGKYQDFLNILDSVYLYSNNFHETTLKIEGGDGVMAEFIFLIPNMLFYTTIGFLTALKTEVNGDDMMVFLEKIAHLCENCTGELADVLIDATDEKRLLEDIFEKQTVSN